MKTTVDIADALMRRLKRAAQRRGTTIKVVMEEALQRELASAPTEARVPVVTHTFRGRGLQEGLSWNDWSEVRRLAYEGRGG